MTPRTRRTRTTFHPKQEPEHPQPSKLPVPAEHLDLDIVAYVESQIQESFAMAGVLMEDPAHDDTYFIRRDIVKHWRKKLEDDIKWLDKIYERELHPDKSLVERKPWLITDRELHKQIKNTLLPVLEYLWSCRVNYNDAVRIARDNNIAKYRSSDKKEPTKVRLWTHVFVTFNYRGAEQRLGIKRRTVQRYIDALLKAGILARFKTARRNEYVYSIGYFTAHPHSKMGKNVMARPMARPFLKRGHREALMQIRIHQG